MFFNDRVPLLRTLVAGVFAYAGLIAFLRLSGKRTLAKMNAFDLVVTVSLGSILATIVLNQEVTLAQGAVALATLISLQYLITWSSVRSSWVRQMVTGEPTLLLYRGLCLDSALTKSRVTHGEICAAVRAAGYASLDDVEAVVLETDGSFSVVRSADGTRASSLGDIARPLNEKTV